MRFLVWMFRVILTAVIGCFVAIVFYMTNDVMFPEAVKATLNWVTVAGAALVGLAWPLMRRYWQALLLLLGLGAFRALFGVHPALSTLHTPLLTQFQSDFLWVPIGIIVLGLVGTIVGRALVSDRNMQAMRRAASTVTTGQDVADETAAALKETPTPAVPEPAALEVDAEGKPEAVESASTEAEPASDKQPTVEENGSEK